MDWDVYIRLSGMMFMEFAVWGAWMPVLAIRLLGPLKMSGKQTGWIYATLPLACIISPLVAGQVADKWLNTEWVLIAMHAIGAVLLFVAARQKKFRPLFWTMLAYSVCFSATLPLVNAVLFKHAEAANISVSMVFIWAPVSWALVGYFLTGLRMVKGQGEGADCLVLAGVLSIGMAAACFFLPATTPAGGEGIPIVMALSALQDSGFAIFLLISAVVAGLMQFYFLGTGQFLQDVGVSGKAVPASMAIAQAAQAIATLLVFDFCMANFGFQWTLILGAVCWVVLYGIYVAMKPTWLIIAAQSLHGVAYVLFIIAGQIFAGEIAPTAAAGSIQALVFVATTGIGLFIFTQFAGFVMDKNSVDGKFQWKKIWLAPGLIMAAGVVALVTMFDGSVGAERIMNKLDTSDDQELTRAEIEQIPDTGLTFGILAYAEAKADMLALFDTTVKQGADSVDVAQLTVMREVLQIIETLDTDGDKQLTRTEIEQISDEGLTFGILADAKAKADMLALFDRTVKQGDDSVNVGQLAAMREELQAAIDFVLSTPYTQLADLREELEADNSDAEGDNNGNAE